MRKTVKRIKNKSLHLILINNKKMKRYIEIIFDDSGSMNGYVNNEPKHIIAKRLFKEKIIPKLDLKKDIVFLRTLSSDCKKGLSNAIPLGNDSLKMTQKIDSISCYNNTPLYYTIKDSIEACKNSGAIENHIFILTDGDDTCCKEPEEILGNDFSRIKNQINLNTILLQFAIESQTTSNNLTAVSQKIGATNIVINSNELLDFETIGKKLNKAFIQSGLDKISKFPHCSIKNPESIKLEIASNADLKTIGTIINFQIGSNREYLIKSTKVAVSQIDSIINALYIADKLL